MKMAPVFVWSRRKDKNIIDIGDAKGEITEDIIHHPLKGGPGVSEAKAGVVKCVCSEGCADCGLRNIGWNHGDLIVTLQEVQLRKDFFSMKIGHDIGDVGERVMVRFRQHVQASVVIVGE